MEMNINAFRALKAKLTLPSAEAQFASLKDEAEKLNVLGAGSATNLAGLISCVDDEISKLLISQGIPNTPERFEQPSTTSSSKKPE